MHLYIGNRTRDRRLDGVGNRERLWLLGHECEAEGMRALIRRCECVIGRQKGGSVGAQKMNRAAIIARKYVGRIQSRDGDADKTAGIDNSRHRNGKMRGE